MSRSVLTEQFESPDLAAQRWVPHYLPHWSSRAESAATYRIADSHLELSIPTHQGLWCADTHPSPLRVSAIASGLYAGPVGSTIGQQPFAEGQTVREAQPEHRGWLLERGTFSVVARADLSPRSMVSVWLTGFEDQPDRCGEVCVFEVFGDTVQTEPATAGFGSGVHAFRDPHLTEEFSVLHEPVDLTDWHRFEVDVRSDGTTWSIDDTVVRESTQAVSYPLQIFVGLFDFPDRDVDGQWRDHVPTFEVDEMTFTAG